MVKRYEIRLGDDAELPEADYILASDFERMRRRLVVKWLKARRRYLHRKAARHEEKGEQVKADVCDRWSSFYWDMKIAIERGKRLEYFRRLGEDK